MELEEACSSWRKPQVADDLYILVLVHVDGRHGCPLVQSVPSLLYLQEILIFLVYSLLVILLVFLSSPVAL